MLHGPSLDATTPLLANFYDAFATAARITGARAFVADDGALELTGGPADVIEPSIHADPSPDGRRAVDEALAILFAKREIDRPNLEGIDLAATPRFTVGIKPGLNLSVIFPDDGSFEQMFNNSAPIHGISATKSLRCMSGAQQAKWMQDEAAEPGTDWARVQRCDAYSDGLRRLGHGGIFL